MKKTSLYLAVAGATLLNATAFATPRVMSEPTELGPVATVRSVGVIKESTATFLLRRMEKLKQLFRKKPSHERYAEIEDVLIALRQNARRIHESDTYKTFSILEWLSDEKNPARVLVTLVYLEKYLQHLPAREREKIRERLDELQMMMEEPEIQAELKGFNL